MASKPLTELMANEAATHSPLLALPAETLVQIAECTDKYDLLALRRTCRELQAAAHDSFVQAFFRSRRHIFTRYGLRALADIARQPNLARGIREVEIVLVELSKYSYGTKGRLESINDNIERGKFCAPDAVHEELVNRYTAWKIWKSETHGLLSQHTSVATVKAAFDDLSTHGRQVAINVSDGDCTGSTSPYGTRQLRSKLGIPHPLYDFGCWGWRTFVSRAVLVALAQSSLSVCSMIVELGKTRPHYKGLELSHRLSAYHGRCLSNLRALELNLMCFYYDWDDNDWAGFTAVAQAAVKLEDLTLSWEGYDMCPRDVSADLLDLIGSCFCTQRLRAVTLHYVYATTASFTDFIRKRSDTLQGLSLYHCAIPSPDCWKNVLVFIQNNMGLRRLRISELERIFETTFVDRQRRWSFEYDTSAELQHGLTHLVNAGRYISSEWVHKQLAKEEEAERSKANASDHQPSQ